MAKVPYRLGLDIGTNSIGWCVYELTTDGDPCSIRRMGVRIFQDGRNPQSLASKAATRRQARQARRRRDRVLKRRHRFLETLAQFDLMPPAGEARKQLQELDPWLLRARGLDSKLTPHELGRALYHLGRKRGFRSSRKDGRDPDAAKESGKVHAAISQTRARVSEAGCRTVGEYLARLHVDRLPIRGRRSADGGYVLYQQRDMVADEFDRLWAAQATFHPDLLTPDRREILRDILLFQRRLHPVRPGRCLFESGEPRARLCSPLQQRFRILQELGNLRVREGIGLRPLNREERDRMLELLSGTAGLVTFAQLAKAASFKNAKAFNFGNDPKRKGFRGDAVGARFAASDALGSKWRSLAPETQQALAVLVEQADQQATLVEALVALPNDLRPAREILGKQEDTDAVVAGLARLPFTLSESVAKRLASFELPDDFGSLGLTALAKIVRELENDVITYDVAVQRAGYTHHSQFYDGLLHDALPYYGELLRGYTSPAEKAKDPAERLFGRLANPTVHIGLNQLRHLVNALIRRFGHPAEVLLELAREFGVSGQRRLEIAKEQEQNQTRNERYDEELRLLGVRPNRENRTRLQLWEELGKDDALDRYCIYSGTRLSKAALFSGEVEIDHILPFSKSLHDGIGNKLLCRAQSNRDKGNRTPFEAFGHTDAWTGILERAAGLPARKAALFAEDALATFLGGKSFLDRQLGDTQYLGRVAKQYLTAICPPDRIWVSSGRLTGLLRAKWGLNKLLSKDSKKNRDDHRHHALDAAVVGVCSRSLLQRVATAAARAEANGENRLLDSLELPWPTFHSDLESTLEKIVVSHRPDHGREGALHNDTNYGLRGGPDAKGNPLVGRRIPVESLRSVANAASIADPLLQVELVALLSPLASAKAIQTALAEWSRSTGVRRVFCVERLAVIPISDRRSGEPYRFVKGDSNYCYEIFRRSDGKWGGEVISTFEANSRDFDPKATLSRSGNPLLFRIHKDDVLLIEQDELRRLLRVTKFTEGVVALAELHEANVDARSRDKSSGFKYMFKSPAALRDLRARPVGVDFLGYVNDSGPVD